MFLVLFLSCSFLVSGLLPTKPEDAVSVVIVPGFPLHRHVGEWISTQAAGPFFLWRLPREVEFSGHVTAHVSQAGPQPSIDIVSCVSGRIVFSSGISQNELDFFTSGEAEDLCVRVLLWASKPVNTMYFEAVLAVTPAYSKLDYAISIAAIVFW